MIEQNCILARISKQTLLSLFISLIFALFSAQNISAQENDLGDFDLATDPATKFITESLDRKLSMLTNSYRENLKKSKYEAIVNVDPEAVMLIKKAIAGEYINDFANSKAEAARKKYDKDLVILAERYVSGLNESIKVLLRADRVREALALKKIAVYIEYNKTALAEVLKNDRKSTASRKLIEKKKSFKVYANKDWQSPKVLLPPATDIEVSTRGKWGPGNSKTKTYKLSTPDTYNLQLQYKDTEAGKGNTFTGGEKWSFNSEDGGYLQGRMKIYDESARAQARSWVLVTLRWKENPTSENGDAKDGQKGLIEPLEYILARYTSDKGEALFAQQDIAPKKPQDEGEKVVAEKDDPKKDESEAKLFKKTYRMKVYAKKDWQIYPISLLHGDKVEIKATGKWTPDSDGREPDGADKFRYAVRIGTAMHGNGGEKYNLLSSAKGKLMLRMAATDWAKAGKKTPAGALELTISIERKGSEIK